MPICNTKTVWVLGAGFSRSLGGPLLDDLFRLRWWGYDEAFYPRQEFPCLASDLYWTRMFFDVGKEHRLWDNAEQFLAYVDDGQGPNETKKRVLRLLMRSTSSERSGLSPSPGDGNGRDRFSENFALCTRRAMAAECDSFLRDANPLIDEKWQPYRRWAGALHTDLDVVLSFNYDLVIEELGDKFDIRVPQSSRIPDRVPVFKLHGSVDWQAPDASRVTRDSIFRSPMACPLIAAPGTSKETKVVSDLSPLWREAEEHLEAAGAIVFVGYSFPKSDVGAGFRLREAMRRDRCGYLKRRRIDLVLGPDINGEHINRVATLLRACGGSRSLFDINDSTDASTNYLWLVRQPLWAEDFLGEAQLHVGFHNLDLK